MVIPFFGVVKCGIIPVMQSRWGHAVEVVRAGWPLVNWLHWMRHVIQSAADTALLVWVSWQERSFSGQLNAALGTIK